MGCFKKLRNKSQCDYQAKRLISNKSQCDYQAKRLITISTVHPHKRQSCAKSVALIGTPWGAAPQGTLRGPDPRLLIKMAQTILIIMECVNCVHDFGADRTPANYQGGQIYRRWPAIYQED